MLSICIPIYNNDCNKLVNELIEQISHNKIVAEIICIDDKSNDNTRKINETIRDKCNYILLKENIGRARIRNKFLEYAKFEWLLFLDNDAIISNPDFITNYCSEIDTGNCNVVCGGTHFLEPLSLSKNNNLCFTYCNHIEQKLKSIKESNSYSSFMTNNFVIKKSILQKIKFDETLNGYGHEDTLFGFMLKQSKISIIHINNNVNCVADDNNKVFLDKTKQAINNLALITQKLNYNKNFIADSTILHFYYNNKFICKIVKLLSPLLEKNIEKKLERGKNSLRLYNFYKLILLCKTNL